MRGITIMLIIHFCMVAIMHYIVVISLKKDIYITI